MLGITDVGAFVLAVLLFLMLPGPGTFAVLTSSAQGGVRAGFAAVLGVMAGDVILVVLALTGVAALLAVHPEWFAFIQYLGIAYLFWVGAQLLFKPGNTAGATLLPIRNAKFFRQAFLITLINPKAIAFYMAFFPLFIDPTQQPGLLTYALMMGIIAIETLFYGGLLVFTGNGLARRLSQRPRVGKLASRLAGLALIGFGLRLARE